MTPDRLRELEGIEVANCPCVKCSGTRELVAEVRRLQAEVHDCPVCGRACKACDCVEQEITRLRGRVAELERTVGLAAVPLETIHNVESGNVTLCPALHRAVAEAVKACRLAALSAAAVAWGPGAGRPAAGEGMMGDDDDEADDFVGRLLFEAVGRPRREAAIRSLLAGNDCQCFTTTQYQEAYDRIGREEHAVRKAKHGWTGEYIGLNWMDERVDGVAEMHLRTSGMVREIEPGVWGPLDPAARPG